MKLSLRLIIELIVLSMFTFLLTQQGCRNKALQKQLAQTQNELSEAVGTIEVADSIYMRMAEEERNLRRQLDAVLGDNSELAEYLENTKERVQSLLQINAALQEEIEFSSDNENSTAVVTVIEQVDCPDVNSDSNSVVTSSEPNSDPIPNIRVDFDLNERGFNVVGHTTTRPARAQLTLRQIDPFAIDLALTQNQDGTWQAYVSEQNELLNLDIGELRVNQMIDRLAWYERIGVGAHAFGNARTFAFGPTVSFETRRGTVISGGPNFDFVTNGIGGTASITIRPFRRNR